MLNTINRFRARMEEWRTYHAMRKAVKRGAALLDARKPSWFHDVELDWLDMHDSRACVFGQLFGNFFSSKSRDLLGVAEIDGDWDGIEFDQKSHRYGFDISNTEDLKREHWNYLGDLWAAEVTTRRTRERDDMLFREA